MRINWKLKSFAFKIINFCKLYGLLYFLQKYITKRSNINIKKINDDWLFHEQNFKGFTNQNIIEIGAGKSLQQNIFLSHALESQTVVDLYPMIDFTLFNKASKA